MSTTQLRIAGAAILFLFIFLFGFWLSRTGKPYNQVLFTIHKLIAVGAVVLLATTIYQVHQVAPLTPLHFSVVGFAALCFVATFATGALLSIGKDLPLLVLRLHQVTPYLTLLSTALILYLLLVKGSNWLNT